MTLPATAQTGCPLSTCLRDATDWETRHSLFGWVCWTRTLCSGSRLLLAHLKSGICHSADPIQTHQPDMVNYVPCLSLYHIQRKKYKSTRIFCRGRCKFQFSERLWDIQVQVKEQRGRKPRYAAFTQVQVNCSFAHTDLWPHSWPGLSKRTFPCWSTRKKSTALKPS